MGKQYMFPKIVTFAMLNGVFNQITDTEPNL